MKTLRYGDTFIARYPHEENGGALYAVTRDRSNRERPTFVTVNASVSVDNITDGTPVMAQGERFMAEADVFEVKAEFGIALGIDRIDLDTAASTPAA